MANNSGKGRARRVREIPYAREPDADELAFGEDEASSTVEDTSLIEIIPGKDRIVLRVVTDDRVDVVEFGVGHQIFVDGEWMDVVRYDTDHGEVHGHRYAATPRGPKQINRWRVAPKDNLKEKCQDLLNRLIDGADENRRRYVNGR